MIISTKKERPKPSKVYDMYWIFASKRYDIFLKRFSNAPEPWTNDPILREYKFTNVFRATDRVSQFLIDLQYSSAENLEDIFFKTLLFKIFNKIETYCYLEKKLGVVNSKSFILEKYDELLRHRMAKGVSIYSAAYIMPSTNIFGHKFKHTNHLELLLKFKKEKVYQKIQDCKNLKEVYSLLLSYPSFGNFLAFQYSIDLNYSSIINFSEMDFVVAGPGAKNGILKCFSSLGDYTFEDIIKWMADNQDLEMRRLNLEPINLFGRRLQLIDCQNLFCEVDKYLRVAKPEMTGKTLRTRIKQKYHNERKGSIAYFFPPKWGINNKIELLCPQKVTENIFL